MHFLQAINSDLSVLIVCNKTGGTIKGDIKKICDTWGFVALSLSRRLDTGVWSRRLDFNPESLRCDPNALSEWHLSKLLSVVHPYSQCSRRSTIVWTLLSPCYVPDWTLRQHDVPSTLGLYLLPALGWSETKETKLVYLTFSGSMHRKCIAKYDQQDATFTQFFLFL